MRILKPNFNFKLIRRITILGFSLIIIATAIFSQSRRLPSKIAGTVTNPLLIDNKFCDNPSSLNQTICTNFILPTLAQAVNTPYQNVNGPVAISGNATVNPGSLAITPPSGTRALSVNDGATACCASYYTVSINEGYGANQPTLQFHDQSWAEGQIILSPDISNDPNITQRGFVFQSTQTSMGGYFSGNIITAGKLGIGTDAPREQLDVAAAAGGRAIVSNGGGAAAQVLILQSPGSLTYARLLAHDYGKALGLNLVLQDTGGNVGIGGVPSYQLHLSRDSAGKPNGGSWANSSDSRLKKNIQPITNALDKISQLKGVNFEWINPAEHGDMSGTQGGFIAQDVEKTFPGWISRIEPSGSDKNLVPEGDKIESLSLPFEFDALIVEAIKEQQKQINPLLGIIDIVNKVGRFIQIETQKLIVNGVDILDKLDRQEKEINELKATVQQLQKQLQTAQ